MSGKEILEEHARALAAAVGLRVDVLQEGNRLFVIVHDYPLPDGVAKVASTDVLFIGDTQYPMSAMDMFWTGVDVVRPDGNIFDGSSSIEQYLGRTWRRFSYHRHGVWNTTGNPLFDHFAFMETRWTRSALK